MSRPSLVCLDMEGVLTPEIWINVAEATGIAALCRTTRDEPDYDKLMRARLAILKDKSLSLHDIQAVIGRLQPLEGAVDFLNQLRRVAPVIVISDTFYQFAAPLMEKLGLPVLFANMLEVAPDGMITGYRLRLPDQKRASTEALKRLNFHVVAAGDSYNDVSMLKAADQGILFRPPQNVIAEFPQFSVTQTYAELHQRIDEASRKEAASGKA